MEVLGITVFRVLASIAVLLAINLLMGQRQIGELSPLDFAISITAGTVAGAAIVDSRIELSGALAALLLLGVLQYILSWVSMKSRKIHQNLSFRPTVVVEDGQIIKANLRKLRLNVETLIQMLRDKDVFAVNEVELAILEPQGKLSVLKKPEYQPVTPSQLNMTNLSPNEVLLPVIIEGELQEEVLARLGFSPQQIVSFHKKYQNELHNVFIAFMNRDGSMHVVNEGIQETRPILH